MKDNNGMTTFRTNVPIINGKKVCNVCKIPKKLIDFHINKSCVEGFTGTCRRCNRVRINKWYKDNRKRRQEEANIRNQKRKTDLVNKFGNKCFDCKRTFPLCVYDFHHLDNSTKDMNPSKALTMKVERMNEELEKCVMLCANCHRIRHFGSRIRPIERRL